MFYRRQEALPATDMRNGAPKPLQIAAAPASGSTVLPSTVASAVSFITRSSTISIRLSSAIGEAVLDSVRLGAMTSIDLGRTVLERVLLTAGRDVRDTRGESWAGKGVDALHSSLSLVQLLLSTSLHLSTFSLNSISALCQSSIMTIDSIFGDTESSRAIAAVMALLQKEFASEQTDSTEVVSVKEVVGGIAWFALVQMRCRRRERETLRGKTGRKLERVLWDVVVLESDTLKDKLDASLKSENADMPVLTRAQSDHPAEVEDVDMEDSCTDLDSDQDSDVDSFFGSGDESQDENGKKRIKTLLCSRLPASASISVTTTSTTTRTTTVEVTGTAPPNFSPPKNAIVLSEASHHTIEDTNGSSMSSDDDKPKYKIVYQTISKKEKKRKMKRKGGDNNDSIITQELACEDLPVQQLEDPGSAQRLIDVEAWRDESSEPTQGVHRHVNNNEQRNGFFLQSPSNERIRPESMDDLVHVQVDGHSNTFKLHQSRSGPLCDTSAISLPNDDVVMDNPVSSPASSTMASADNLQDKHAVATEDDVNQAGKASNTANTKRSIVKPLSHAPKLMPKSAGSGFLGRSKRTELSTSPPSKVTKESKDKRPGTLRRAWNSSTFSTPTAVLPTREKRKSTATSATKDLVPAPSVDSSLKHHRTFMKQNPIRRSSPVMTRADPMTTTSKSRSELVGIERSSSRTSLHNGDVEEALQRQNSYLSLRSRTSMTTRAVLPDDTHSMQDGQSQSHNHHRYSGHDFITQQNHDLAATYARSNEAMSRPISPVQSHRHSRNFHAPSIYTLRTTNSQTSLFRDFSSGKFARNSPTYDDMSHAGIYPPNHPVLNMARFVRFASASYGQDFLRLLGIGEAHPKQRFVSTDAHHAEHHAFSHHTKIPLNRIILSSFVDTKVGGGEDGLVPLVHFVCIDDDSKAIVVTCRGTLGLEDVLTDMTCDYDNLDIRGQIYRVHKGMLKSALTLVRRGSKLLQTIRDAMIEYEDYGLVFCGHSLGGGVAAILAILLSEPCGVGFVTSNSNTADCNEACPDERVLVPTGRPVHCYSFGSPACVDTALRLATRRLITSVVHGADIVPSLSIGILRDFQNVALAFKQDSAPEGAKVVEEIRRRVLVNLARRRAWLDEGDDDFLWAVLKTLRATMSNEKLVPPGEVILVSTETVFTKESSMSAKEKPGPMRQAVKVTGKLIRSVETRFGEVKFGRGMFADHSPREYESCLNMLVRGVCGNLTE